MAGNKIILSSVVLIFAVSLASAVDLIVTTNAKSYWASKVKKDEKTVSFVLNDSGKATNMPLETLYAIVPGVDKGKTYSDQDIAAALDIISNARTNCGVALTKQLKILQNEWEAIRAASDPEMDRNILAEIEKFKAGKKSKSDYSDAMLGLGMVRYKDVLGVYSSKLDNAIGVIQQEYIGVDIRRLELKASEPKISVDDYLKLKLPATLAMKKDMPPEERKRLKSALDKARMTTVTHGVAEALSFVSAGKSIENYLKSRTILVGLRRNVAETQGEKSSVEKALSDIVQSVRSVFPDYDFSNSGFPLTTRDREILAKTKPYSSTQLIIGTAVDEQCLIIMEEPPDVLTRGKQVIMPMTLVFNRAATEPGEYALAMAGLQGGGTRKHYAKPANLSIRGGHATVRHALDFAAIGPDAAPFRDEAGSYTMVFLAWRALPEGSKKNDVAEWKAISMACRIPVLE